MKSIFSKIPSINDLLSDLRSGSLSLDPKYLKILTEEVVAEIKLNPTRYRLEVRTRREIHDLIISTVTARVKKIFHPAIDRVVNATGIVLHTGLGRAPLGSQLIGDLNRLSYYTNLEIDLETGKRGDRHDHLLPLLKLITGTEDAVVTNNNAAAVLLILNSLAKRKEVIISRGELVEIGGSFRLPEVMKTSQAKMVEIGSTNKTHLKDYQEAISTRTAAIMVVHPSNYKIIGFTEKPAFQEIIGLAGQHNIPVIYDLGSGAMINMQSFGFGPEPLVPEVLKMGFDVVCFSGDKLLGGPQAGIIVGKKVYLDKIRRNHLLRALRCDKITIALLYAVLKQYLNPDYLIESNLSLALFTRPPEQMKKSAKKIIKSVKKSNTFKLSIVDAPGQVGSGAYPVYEIPAFALQIKSLKYSANQLAKIFRQLTTPVLGYITDESFHLHLLTLFEEDLPLISKAINKLR